jgi:hypothetical protein
MVRCNGEDRVATMAQPSDPLSVWLMAVASIRAMSRAASKECAAKYTSWFPPHQSLPIRQNISLWKRHIPLPSCERNGDYR